MQLTDFTVARTVPASAERIFDAWLNSAVLADHGSVPRGSF